MPLLLSEPVGHIAVVHFLGVVLANGGKVKIGVLEQLLFLGVGIVGFSDFV